MNVLLVAKLSNQTLTENILSPLLKSSYVDHVYVLRDFPGDMIDGKVTYLSPEKVSESRIRHIRKVVAGVRYCSKYKIDVIISAWLYRKSYRCHDEYSLYSYHHCRAS